MKAYALQPCEATTAWRSPPELPEFETGVNSETEEKDGEAGNEHGDGGQCGEITKEVGHGVLLLVMFVLCSIFVPFSSSESDGWLTIFYALKCGAD